MAVPHEFQILVNLQAALAGMTRAGGYYFDAPRGSVRMDPNVEAESLELPDGLRPFQFIEVKPEVWSIVGMPQALRLDWPISIHWVNECGAEDTDRMRMFLQGCADVERAVARDMTFGGLVHSTEVAQRVAPATEGGTLVWARIDLRLVVHRKFGRPDVN